MHYNKSLQFFIEQIKGRLTLFHLAQRSRPPMGTNAFSRKPITRGTIMTVALKGTVWSIFIRWTYCKLHSNTYLDIFSGIKMFFIPKTGIFNYCVM